MSSTVVNGSSTSGGNTVVGGAGGVGAGGSGVGAGGSGAGAGLLSMYDVISSGETIPAEVWVGMVAAGLSGYAAIAILLKLLARVGLVPFGIYCVAFGVFSIIML